MYLVDSHNEHFKICEGIYNFLSYTANLKLSYNPAGRIHCRLQNHIGYIIHHLRGVGGSLADVGEVPMTKRRRRGDGQGGNFRDPSLRLSRSRFRTTVSRLGRPISGQAMHQKPSLGQLRGRRGIGRVTDMEISQTPSDLIFGASSYCLYLPVQLFPQ